VNDNEAVVRVKLDTRHAKSDLADLTKTAGGVAGKLGSGFQSALGSGVRALGIGTAIGAGIAAVRGATAGGVSSVLSETFGGIGAQLEHFVLGDLAPQARASHSAREETKNAYATIAGITGSIPPSARNFYEQTKQRMFEAEKGKAMFDRDSQFQGTSWGQAFTKITEEITGAISAGFDRVIESIKFW
jgi:hypothetical protein